MMTVSLIQMRTPLFCETEILNGSVDLFSVFVCTRSEKVGGSRVETEAPTSVRCTELRESKKFVISMLCIC